MINPRQIRDLIIKPTLAAIMPDPTGAATELLLGTAAQESMCGDYIAQVGGGPALGIWQMEPATHDDLWTNFLAYHKDLRDKISPLVSSTPWDDKTNLIGNLWYACAMARVLYYRVPMSLPKVGDLRGQAAYYKQYYNTPAGAATVEQYIANWHRIAPLL